MKGRPVSIFSREKNENIYPYFDQILMDLRKILENYRHLCKKVVIFRKNETALKVCWLGVEKLVFFWLFGGGGMGGQGHFDFHHGDRDFELPK